MMILDFLWHWLLIIYCQLNNIDLYFQKYSKIYLVSTRLYCGRSPVLQSCLEEETKSEEETKIYHAPQSTKISNSTIYTWSVYIVYNNTRSLSVVSFTFFSWNKHGHAFWSLKLKIKLVVTCNNFDETEISTLLNSKFFYWKNFDWSLSTVHWINVWV